jgi:hypothetical protein
MNTKDQPDPSPQPVAAARLQASPAAPGAEASAPDATTALHPPDGTAGVLEKGGNGGDGKNLGGNASDLGKGGGAPGMAQFDQFRWLEIEYQKAADRYDNIYKSYWSTFSYTGAISAAILAFGGNQFSVPFTIVLACFPPVFWYWASALPLDRYGDQAAERLKQLEALVRGLFGSATNVGGQPTLLGPCMFTQFERRKDPNQRPADPPKWGSSWQEWLAALPLPRIRANPLRVRAVVNFAAVWVHLAFISALGWWLVTGAWIAKPKTEPQPTVTIDVGKNLEGVLRDGLKLPPRPQGPGSP